MNTVLQLLLVIHQGKAQKNCTQDHTPLQPMVQLTCIIINYDSCDVENHGDGLLLGC